MLFFPTNGQVEKPNFKNIVFEMTRRKCPLVVENAELDGTQGKVQDENVGLEIHLTRRSPLRPEE